MNRKCYDRLYRQNRRTWTLLSQEELCAMQSDNEDMKYPFRFIN